MTDIQATSEADTSWWTDVLCSWNLKFLCASDEQRYRATFFRERRLYGALAASVELCMTALSLYKATLQSNLQDPAVRLHFNSTVLVFMLLTRALPTNGLLFARTNARPAAAVAYRLARVPYACMSVLFYTICANQLGCFYKRGAWLDVFLFSLTLMPLFVQVPFAWHLPIHAFHALATAVYVLGPTSMCSPLQDSFSPSLFPWASAPLVGLSRYMGQHIPVVAYASSAGCAGPITTAASAALVVEQCPEPHQWLTAVLRASSVLLHALVPSPSARQPAGLSSTGGTEAAMAPALFSCLLDQDQWQVMLQRPCETVSLLLLVSGSVVITVTLYWWELKSRVQWWLRHHPGCQVAPPLPVLSLLVLFCGCALFVVSFVGIWCFMALYQ